MLLAALLMAAQPAEPYCRRDRWWDDDLRPCLLERRAHDVLDGARRPELPRLGRDAIRFSTMPELGGTAAIVEIADIGRPRLPARVYELDGHPRLGWELEDSHVFTLSRREYLNLAAGVDSALADYRPPIPDPDNGEMIVCMDGPGFLTERIVNGRVTSLAGNCPPSEQVAHPNSRIVALFVEIVCRHLGHQIASALRPYDRQLQRRCPAG
jgi:hypothetical protein